MDVTLRREVARAGRAMYRQSFSLRCVEQAESWGPAFKEKPCRDALCLMLGSATGTVSNVPLPGDLSVLPLTFDAFSLLGLSALNSPVFANFLGTLDTNGAATASLVLPALPVSAGGTTLQFSFLCFSPAFDLSPRPAAVRLTL